MKRVLIDTNIIVRYLVGDLPDKQKDVEQMFLNAEKENIKYLVLDQIIIETIFVLTKVYKLDKSICVKVIVEMLELACIDIETNLIIESMNIYLDENIEIVDAYMITYALQNNIGLQSFDKKALNVWKKLANISS